ncbi:MAG: hypothetical protein IT289_11730 [Oligoflexia bacterium]|nr:hypothetical protein [Oligoflexia bacterium]
MKAVLISILLPALVFCPPVLADDSNRESTASTVPDSFVRDQAPGAVITALGGDQQSPEKNAAIRDRDAAEIIEALETNPSKPVALDVFRLLNQEYFSKPKHVFPRENIDLSALVLRAYTSEGKRIEINQRQFTVYDGEIRFFEISYQGFVLNRFLISANSLSFADGKIFFTETGSFLEGAQNVSYIDARQYLGELGHTPIPVYRIPIPSQGPMKLSKNGNGLSVGEVALSPSLMDPFSQMNELAFNLTDALTDPKRLEQMQPLLENLEGLFFQAAQVAGGDGKDQILRSEAFLKTIGQMATSQKAALMGGATTEQDRLVSETAQSISQQVTTQRRLISRITHLWGALTLPKPLAGIRLTRALAMMASGLNPLRFDKSKIKESLLAFGNHPAIQLTGATALGLALGATYPEAVTQFFYQGLEIGRSLVWSTLGFGRDILHLSWRAAEATFAGFNPKVLYNTYIQGDRLMKTAIGMTAVFSGLAITLGIPHLTANTISLFKDLKGTNWKQIRLEEGSYYKAFKRIIIERQNKLQRDYIHALSEAESKNSGAKVKIDLNAEEEAALQDGLQQLHEFEKGDWIYRFLKRFESSKTVQENQSASISTVRTLRGALTHFIFSLASFTQAGTIYAKIWNGWFAFRSFVWTPKVLAAYMLFPTLFNLSVQGRLPNEFNGGNRGVLQRLLMSKDELRRLEQWEQHFAELEGRIYKEAFKAVLPLFIAQLRDPKDLQKLYQSKLGDHRARVFDELSQSSQVFFRTHFDRVVHIAERKLLRQTLGLDPLDALTDQQIKEATLKVTGPAPLTDEEIRRTVSEVAQSPELIAQSQEIASDPSRHSKFAKAKWDLLRQVDPKTNRQVYRMEIVKEQLKDPQAVAQAVRAALASNFIDRPQELVFTFLCMAGIEKGFLAPIQDQFIGDNSLFYLSRIVFGAGYFYATVTGILAEIWMKIQTDYQHKGQTNDAPEGEEAKLSFLKYYLKKTFRNPKNTLWDNYWYNMGIIIANLRAAFTNTLTNNMLFMGRFDVDSYLTGYMMTGTPYTGLDSQLDQGFEFAKGYYAKFIPKELRSHPRAQEALNGAMTRARLRFNMYRLVYQNVIGFYLFNLPSMPTDEFGSRSLSRILLGGWTFTELGVRGLQKVQAATSFIPGSRAAFDFCINLLANKFSDWEKIPPVKK